MSRMHGIGDASSGTTLRDRHCRHERLPSGMLLVRIRIGAAQSLPQEPSCGRYYGRPCWRSI